LFIDPGDHADTLYAVKELDPNPPCEPKSNFDPAPLNDERVWVPVYNPVTRITKWDLEEPKETANEPERSDGQA